MKKILVVSDQKPGHFNQSYGVVAALQRRATFDVSEISVSRFGLLPRRASEVLLKWHWFPNSLHLMLVGFFLRGIRNKPDIIVSAGGKTLIANVLLARHFGAANIFSGSIRGVDKSSFSAILQIYREYEDIEPYIVGLKPSPAKLIDRPPAESEPQQICLLVGGPTAAHKFSSTEFDHLCRELVNSRLNWKIVTSRRTPPGWSRKLAELEGVNNITIFDFAKTGPLNTSEIMKNCDAAVVTSDSTSMISECIASGLPTVSLTSQSRLPTKDDDYLEMLHERGWFNSMPMQDYSQIELRNRLKTSTPSIVDHTELLADALENSLPQIFS